jgi:hypothetical protein
MGETRRGKLNWNSRVWLSPSAPELRQGAGGIEYGDKTYQHDTNRTPWIIVVGLKFVKDEKRTLVAENDRHKVLKLCGEFSGQAIDSDRDRRRGITICHMWRRWLCNYEFFLVYSIPYHDQGSRMCTEYDRPLQDICEPYHRQFS